MSNRGVFEAFAEGREARSGSMQVRLHEKWYVLYSYATPIAYRRVDQTTAYFDARTYSVTTSKQRSQAMANMAQMGIEAELVEHNEFRERVARTYADLSLAR